MADTNAGVQPGGEDAYVGWLRPRGGRWREACAGPTDGDCTRRLLAAIRELPAGESVAAVVLPAGRHPLDPAGRPAAASRVKDAGLYE